MNLTRITAKPHIFYFIREEYAKNVAEGKAVIYIPPSQLLRIIEQSLTSSFQHRITTPPQGCTFFDVLLPERINKLFLQASKTPDLLRDLEGWYWTMAKLQLCMIMLNDDLTMSQAIVKFYQKYHYTEDIYSSDTFRRQITRSSHGLPVLKGIRPVSNDNEPRICNKIPNREARKIPGLHRKGMSYRSIGRFYGIDKETVKKIIETLSQKTPTTRQKQGKTA